MNKQLNEIKRLKTTLERSCSDLQKITRSPKSSIAELEKTIHASVSLTSKLFSAIFYYLIGSAERIQKIEKRIAELEKRL